LSAQDPTKIAANKRGSSNILKFLSRDRLDVNTHVRDHEQRAFVRIRTTAQNGAKEGPALAGGAKSGTLFGVDLELVAVIQAWAELPESVKDAVLEVVRECG